MASSRLRPALRIWLAMIIVEVLALGLASMVYPEWYRNTAYDFARSIIPIEAWGVIWFAIGVVMVVALMLGARLHGVLRVTLAWHGVVQTVWAASILALTLNGSALGAFAGSLQWGIVGLVSMLWAGATLTIHRHAADDGYL
jgi:hypothetical protein